MRTTDDEIDLIELFEILWRVVILTVTILATIVGFATRNSPSRFTFEVQDRVPYAIQLHR